MICILLSVLVLLIVNFGMGIIVRALLCIKEESFVFVSFLGIIAITFLATIIAFFFPISSYIELFFIAMGLFGFFRFAKSKQLLSIKEEQSKLWFFLFFTVIIIAASFSPYLYDHYSYYVPTIFYLKEVGFIKGISSFDLLLGQASFWHIYQAVFSNFIDPFLKINAYLSILFLIYVFEKKNYFLLITLPVFLLFVQQPSPDLPILILTIIVVNELLNGWGQIILFYLSFFAFCIKPVVFWLPLFVLLYFIYERKLSKKIIFSFLIFISITVVKNIWLYGFPIFPVSFPNMHLAWQPSKEILTYSSQIGIMKTYDMQYSFKEVSEFSWVEKIYHWFAVGYKAFFNIAIVVSLLIISLFAIKKRSRIYRVLVICLFLKLILIFTFSAQYRFFIDVYAIAAMLIFRELPKSKTITISFLVSIFIICGFAYPKIIHHFGFGRYIEGFTLSQIYKPEAAISHSTTKVETIGNLKFQFTQSSSLRTNFPTLNKYNLRLYQYYGVFPQLYGRDYKDGFYQRKLSEKEKIQLQKIMTDAK